MNKILLILSTLIITLVLSSSVMADWANCPAATFSTDSQVAVTIAKGLIIFLMEPPTSIVSKNELLDLIIFYFNPMDCNDNHGLSGVRIIEIANKIDPSIGWFVPIPGVCSDGTLDGTCSTTKPFYCTGGLLVQGCDSYSCGCNMGYTCNTGLNTCDPYIAESSILIKNNGGRNVAIFDGVGNLGINGSCSIGSCDSAPPTDDSFKIKDIFLSTLAYIDSKGDLCINEGDCVGNDPDCSNPGDGAFVIKNDAGSIIAYINSTGGLCLKGDLIADAALP